MPAGSSSKITEQNLKATDVDSDSLKIRYTLTKDPPAGKLQLSRSDGRVERLSARGPVQSFTQDDVNKGAESRREPPVLSERLTFDPVAVSPGLLHYSHEKGEKGGSLSLKFNLVDPEGNKLIDQSFFISVLGNSPAASHIWSSPKQSATVEGGGGGGDSFIRSAKREKQLLHIYPSCPARLLTLPESKWRWRRCTRRRCSVPLNGSVENVWMK